MRDNMSERLSLEQITGVMTGFGMTPAEAAQFLLLAEIFLDVSIELEHRTTLTVSFRGGMFMTQGGEVVREVESLDEQALQERAHLIAAIEKEMDRIRSLDLEKEDPREEDSWEPSSPEALRVFTEYDDLTGDFDE